MIKCKTCRKIIKKTTRTHEFCDHICCNKWVNGVVIIQTDWYIPATSPNLSFYSA